MYILLSINMRLFITISLIILLFIALHLKYNRKNETTIVERFGKFHQLIDEPHLFFLFPFIDRVLQRIPVDKITEKRRFTYQENDQEEKSSFVLTYTVFDPRLFAYASFDPVGSITDLIITAKEHHIPKEEMVEQIKSYGRDLGLTVNEFHLE